jgi:CubicO group peptidase (beta-lactamase class C family)
MQGFPPAPASQVTLANWRTAPFNKWAFQHVREIVPSADIANDPDNVWQLKSAPLNLDDVKVELGASTLAFADFLQATDTDAIVILHRGRIVQESYFNGMAEHTPHILMSVSKSMLGLLIGQLVGHGVIDIELPAKHYVPELEQTGYRAATVRDLLDMRSGVLFDEDYLATSGAIIEYRKAQGWNPLAPGDTASDLRSFLQTVSETDGSPGSQGGRFHYQSPNTDLLGWIIERATGRRYADLMSTMLWRPLGAARSAYITVDRLGAPRCAGGMCVTARDLARVGLQDIANNGDPVAWARGDFATYFSNEAMSYRSKWYVQLGSAPTLFGWGVNGQHLFVDSINQIVIAKFSSQAMAVDQEWLKLTMAAVAALRKHLIGG